MAIQKMLKKKEKKDNMKRAIMFAMLIGTILLSYAASYNPKQETLRSAIESSLKSKGYTVERQDDGLKFKSEGINYFVEISKDDTNPMYVRLTRYIKFDDKIKRDDVMAKLKDYNSTYAVKAYCKEKNLILSADMLVTSADQFTNVISDLLSLIKSAAENINK